MFYPNFNVLQWVFFIITFLVVFLGTLVQLFEDSIPFIAQMYRYGKFANAASINLQTTKVPKRWFRHFYVFSSIASSYTLWLVVQVYILKSPAPGYVIDFLDLFGSNFRQPTVSAMSVLIATTLVTMQCWKRFYEVYFVSVFSNSKMDIGHYFLGYIHYFGVVVALLLAAPGFSRTSGNAEIDLKELFNIFTIFSLMLFFSCWYLQFHSASILANLRKNKKGDVVTQKHLMPRGGAFEYISSPHISCEIAMYISLTIILLGNSTWIAIFFWVLANQTSTAIMNHQWYVSCFPNYPKERKILVPYVF